MPFTPTEILKEANIYEIDGSQEGDTQEYPEMYPPRFHPTKIPIEAETSSHQPTEGPSEAKASSPEPTEGHGEGKTDLLQPKEEHTEAKLGLPPPTDTVGVSKIASPVPRENSSAALATSLKEIPPPRQIVTISNSKISGGKLNYLVSWLPRCYLPEQLNGLKSTRYELSISICGPIRIVCWHPTWESPETLPQGALISYYDKNLSLLRPHMKIFKPLKDVERKIAESREQQSENPSEEVSGKRSRKRKANYNTDGASKKLNQ
ncbi:hypothetical protein AOQ84DRAFT_377010 [Glonium stellatum]|uniref:Uncharacterized protein n=1 Tax=Glonium stellatum TaxID=574774 RepID=A0A8E2F0F2_9PEZI|nr:hypothetical protein AOQ84DRAFT_377010 [Glonium stellatum]